MKVNRFNYTLVLNTKTKILMASDVKGNLKHFKSGMDVNINTNFTT